LSNDHPISIAITALPSAGQSQTTLPFTASKVECSSCHDPHDTVNTPFLRLTNDSTLCSTCHTDK
jgi:predicted CXXCH cytochrome family protein